ncbi:MAG: hypothetical protein LC790_09325, partial [Actinobacteria bacterium]|nr:hypothetical protein [Actinomycetota bacterium]
VSLEQLAREPFVSVTQADVPGLAYRQSAIFQDRGLSPPSVQEVPDILSYYSLIAAGAGIGLHMASLSNLPHTGLAFRPLTANAPTAKLLLLRRADDQRELVQRFADTALQTAQTLPRPPVLANRPKK